VSKFKEGDVVMVSTCQAGTICGFINGVMVLLQNKDIWYGKESECWEPTSPEELAAAKLDFDRFKK
jgi:hypothetical protein